VAVAAESPRQLDQRRDSASEHRGATGPDPGSPRLRGGDELAHGNLELRPEARSTRRRNPRIDAGSRTEAETLVPEPPDPDPPSLVGLADHVPRRPAPIPPAHPPPRR